MANLRDKITLRVFEHESGGDIYFLVDMYIYGLELGDITFKKGEDALYFYEIWPTDLVYYFSLSNADFFDIAKEHMNSLGHTVKFEGEMKREQL